MILGFPVLIIGLTHGLHSGILEGSPTTIAKQLSLIPWGTLVHLMVLILCQAVAHARRCRV